MQVLTNCFRKRTVEGFFEVDASDALRIPARAGTHGGDNLQIAFQTTRNQVNLRSERVDCIQNAVETLGIQKGLKRFIFQKFIADMEFQLRVDCEKPFRHCFRFGAAGGQSCRNNLPVAVGIFHNIAVDNREFADRCTGKKFRCNSADAPETDAQNVRPFNPVQSLFSQKKLRPALPACIHLPKTLR